MVADVVLGPAVVNSIRDMLFDALPAHVRILTLLFEYGLELSIEGLDKLRNYALGLETLQLVTCLLDFGAFPFVGGVEFLERAVDAWPGLVAIT